MHAGAVCIDLPWKSQPKRLFEFRIRRAGEGRLVVRGPRGRTLAVVGPFEEAEFSDYRSSSESRPTVRPGRLATALTANTTPGMNELRS